MRAAWGTSNPGRMLQECDRRSRAQVTGKGTIASDAEGVVHAGQGQMHSPDGPEKEPSACQS